MLQYRYKIIDIFNEAPDFVANKKKQIYKLSDIKFGLTLSDDDEADVDAATNNYIATQKTDNSTPTDNSRKIILLGANSGQKNEDNEDTGKYGISNDDKDQILEGRYIQFQFKNEKSKATDRYK